MQRMWLFILNHNCIKVYIIYKLLLHRCILQQVFQKTSYNIIYWHFESAQLNINNKNFNYKPTFPIVPSMIVYLEWNI